MKNMICQKGAAVVEFALIFPLLLMLVFGIIEFSLLLYNQQVITNASREGARAGIVSQIPCVSDITITGIVDSYVSDALVTFGTPNLPTTTITRTDMGGDGNDCGFGDQLRVTVNYQYGFLFVPGIVNNLFSGLMGSTRDMVGDTIMIHE